MVCTIQLPTNSPGPNTNTPVNLDSGIEVLIFIVAPVVLIVLYFYLRKKSIRKDRGRDSDGINE